MPLDEKYAGKWHRSAGHPDTAVYIHPSAASKERPAGTKISTLADGMMQEITINILSIPA